MRTGHRTINIIMVPAGRKVWEVAGRDFGGLVGVRVSASASAPSVWRRRGCSVSSLLFASFKSQASRSIGHPVECLRICQTVDFEGACTAVGSVMEVKHQSDWLWSDMDCSCRFDQGVAQVPDAPGNGRRGPWGAKRINQPRVETVGWYGRNVLYPAPEVTGTVVGPAKSGQIYPAGSEFQLVNAEAQLMGAKLPGRRQLDL